MWIEIDLAWSNVLIKRMGLSTVYNIKVEAVRNLSYIQLVNGGTQKLIQMRKCEETEHLRPPNN